MSNAISTGTFCSAAQRELALQRSWYYQSTRPPVQAAAPGEPGRPVVPLGLLAGAVALFGGLTLLAARRTRVRIRPHRAA